MRFENKTTNKSFLIILSLCLLILLYGYVGFNSYGYDDEFYTIADVESYPTIIEQIQINNSVDIHPPGSYIVCLILWKMTNNWHLVRLISGVINAIAIWAFWRLVICGRVISKNGDSIAIIYSYIVTCLNPSILMWGTSIRWFTYVIPCVCLLGILFCYPPRSSAVFWAMNFGIYLWMFYLENTTAIIIVTSFLITLYHRRDLFARELKIIAGFGAITLILALHQIYIFFTVRIGNFGVDRAQSGIISGIIYGAENILCGQAVMPVSFWGIVLILANLILFTVFIINVKNVLANDLDKTFLASYLCYMVTGLGALRNYSSLFSLQGYFMSDVFCKIKKNWVRYCVLFLTIVGTCGGIYNAAFHVNTTKKQWNMPFGEAIDYIHENTDSIENTLVLSKDSVLLYYLREEGYNTVLFEGYQQFEQQRLNPDWENVFDDWNGTIIAVKTFEPSGRHDPYYERYLEKIAELEGSAECVQLGNDKFAWFKKLMDPNIEDWEMKIYTFSVQE